MANQHQAALARGALSYTDADGNTQRVTEDTPLPIAMFALVNVLKEIADSSERIQEQLATLNDGDNLAPGERRY